MDWQNFAQWLVGILGVPAFMWLRQMRHDIDALHKTQRLHANYLKLIIREIRQKKKGP